MPRPRKCRRIFNTPDATYFKPVGVHMRQLENVELTYIELEAIRLKDYLKLNQNECAEKMEISQPTFNRLLHEARYKISDALINNKAIKIISTKNYKMVDENE